ncbi:hypothetical protein BDFB_014628 [Asbolus verrucosus]|uniref:Uncharacterized protein n=1 Tax=Asbolus verrucosus TaxID=1661398 RepID=A0A482VFD4_ASBVE|nr:hypothetical protein BDFB_014628 [Asbolus verrucosus]
MKYLLSSK